MEGDPEESDEDVQGDDKPAVLWEKRFEQSIFVDLSEDESLHFSDLESSLALHLSQAGSAASEASIHLSGSAELSPLNETSSEISSVSSQSVRVEKSKTRSSKLHVSVQRPNTMQDQRYEDPGQNTSDEDQEDLPFDGDLGSPYFNQTGSSEGNEKSDGCTIHASPELPGLFEDASRKQENFLEAAKPSVIALPCPGPSDINQVLLRHFSQEELLRPGRLIEAETLPEVSLLESVDDTLFSSAPTYNSVAIRSDHTESCHGRSNTAAKNTSLKEETQKETDHFTSSAADDNDMSSSVSADSNQCSGDVSAGGVKQEEAEEDDEVQKVPLLRTRSFSEMKYGQGQVHYPLPDFSKVAPKVKIPKTPSGPARSVPQCQSTMHRAQSSPMMLEVISRVLEDSVQQAEQPYVFRDDDKPSPPALVHHLQAEYDKLLTKYAEAENLIDQMRLGTNAQPSSDLMLDLEHDADDLVADQGELVNGSHLGAPHLSPPENFSKKVETTPSSTVKEATTASSSQPQDDPSDGERMTAELRDIISQFMQKVEEFKFSVSTKTASTEEQQMMLRSMMEAQDQLERNYMSKKDEHRALEMQNYMGLSRNTGTFDPNRLVEGDIFRIGMHLEDIKEMIDKNVYEQISPPHSSSTPTPVTSSHHEESSPLCMPTFSSPPSLHEEPSAAFSTVSDGVDVQRKKEGEEEEAGEVHINGGLDQSSEFISDDPLMNNSGCNNHQSRVSLDSLEGLNIHTSEDEEGDEEKRSSALSEVINHSDGTSSAPRQRQQTTGSSVLSCSTLDGVLDLKGECDLGDCVSLAVEVSSSSDALRDSHSLSESPLNTSQRIVSPETDSGFGSSYLNQSASGSIQPNLLSQSGHSQNESLSISDSEGSCSNLQTTIHSAALPGHQWVDTHPSVQTQHCEAAAAVELWVESTTKEPSGCLQGSDQNLPAQLHLSQPLLSSAMDTEDRGSPLYSCSCNNEAILALQSEVSRLKKDLEVGLVQLPHLEQKMDYLTSKYRQERRSKTRSHQRPACNSAGKSSSRGVSNLRSSQVKIEDWISSDMDPSKSKGTGSGDTSCSEIVSQEINSPVGSRRGGTSLCSTAEFQYRLQETTQSNRGTVGNIGIKVENDGTSESNIKKRAQTAIMKSFYSKDKWALLSSPSLQKPLLQVSYGSSSSLPASYKMREPPLQSTSHYRKRSTQSDSALLPSNVYFQRTLSPGSVASKTGSRTSRRSRTKEEDMNKTLDQAIEVARSMKRTTDRMARRLSADLAKAQLHRKLHNIQPLGGRKHQAL